MQKQYCIYRERDGSFLTLDKFPGIVSISQQISLDRLIGDSISASTAALPVSTDIAGLLWQLIPSDPILADGSYQFIWPVSGDRCLARAGGSSLIPGLSQPNPADGSQWWTVTAKVSDRGSIYYRITNFLSNELLELSPSGLVLGASDGVHATQF